MLILYNNNRFVFTLGSLQAVNIICFAMFCHFTVVPASHTLKPYWPSLHRCDCNRRILISY